MNLNSVLRPALRTLTAGLVTAVAVATLAAPSATIAGKEGLKNSKPTISAGKEGNKKRQADVTFAGKEGNKKRQADIIFAGKEGLKKRVAAPGAKFSAADLDLVAVTAAPALSTTTYESQVQASINAVRKAHGLRALTLQSCTDRYAEGWSSKLAASGGFYHRSMSSILRGCRARYAGETLGRGQISPQTLTTMWMNSAPHRRVLLSSKATRIGVGAVPNRGGQWVVTANFTRF